MSLIHVLTTTGKIDMTCIVSNIQRLTHIFTSQQSNRFTESMLLLRRIGGEATANLHVCSHCWLNWILPVSDSMNCSSVPMAGQFCPHPMIRALVPGINICFSMLGIRTLVVISFLLLHMLDQIPCYPSTNAAKVNAFNVVHCLVSVRYLNLICVKLDCI